MASNALQQYRKEMLGLLGDQTRDSTQRLSLIVDSPHSKALVRSLHSPELFFLMLDLGLEDSSELLQLASVQQLADLQHFAFWRGGELVPERAVRWLEWAKSAGDATLKKSMENIGPEAAIALLLKLGAIGRFDGEPEQEDELGEKEFVVRSPDGSFFMVCETEAAMQQAQTLIDLLYQADEDLARDLLTAAVFELLSNIEHLAEDFRTARLEELGFPPMQEAMELYELLSPAEVKRMLEAPGPVPAAPAPRAAHLDAPEGLLALRRTRRLETPTLLQQGLNGLSEDERRRVLNLMIYLMNGVLVVECAGDLTESPEPIMGMKRVEAFMNLGLEILQERYQAEVSDCLRRLNPRILFRLGYSSLLPLRRRAIELRRLAWRDRRFALLEDLPLGPVLDGLSGFIPRCFVRISASDVPEYSDFRTHDDIDRMKKHLAQAESWLTYLRDVLGLTREALEQLVPVDQRPFVTASTLVATRLANSILAREGFAPLEADDVAELLDLVFPWDQAGGTRRLEPTMKAVFETRLQSEDPGVQTLLRFAIEKLLRTLERVPSGEAIEPRFLGTALLVK